MYSKPHPFTGVISNEEQSLVYCIQTWHITTQQGVSVPSTLIDVNTLRINYDNSFGSKIALPIVRYTHMWQYDNLTCGILLAEFRPSLGTDPSPKPDGCGIEVPLTGVEWWTWVPPIGVEYKPPCWVCWEYALMVEAMPWKLWENTLSHRFRLTYSRQ